MKKRFFSYLFLMCAVLFQASCTAPQSEDANSDIKKDSLSESVTQGAIPDFTRSYEGSIGGKYGILMTLTKTGNTLTGTYSYKTVGVSIKLSGTTKADGSFTLNGYDEKGNACDLFKGKIEGPSVTGTWSKPDGSKSLDFSVSESSNTEAQFQKEKAVADNTISGTYKSGGNTLILHETNNGDLQFEIIGIINENCAGNGVTGIASHLILNGAAGNGFGIMEWWEFADGDCTLEFKFGENGSIVLTEGDCSDFRCARNYPWGGTYKK